jgi:transcriptional regulator with XRE-family HTH domain
MKHEGKTNIKGRFGAAIKKRRHDLRLSQEELAERAGLHRTYIGDIERGARNVSIENVEKLAKALEISISKLFENIWD